MSDFRTNNPLRWCIRLYHERTILVLMVLFFGGVSVMVWHLSDLASDLTQKYAIDDASRQSSVLEQFRTLYTSEVVSRVRPHDTEVTHDYDAKNGAIPLPATLSLLLADQLSESDVGGEVRLFSEYPFPWRTEGGPRDDFERDALRQLKQHPEQPFYRFENIQGRPTLRYATADRLRASCVSCHNTHPDSPKTDWKKGDVRGVLVVNQPVDEFTAYTNGKLRGTFVFLICLALAGFLGLTYLIIRTRATLDKLRPSGPHSAAVSPDSADDQEPQSFSVLKVSVVGLIVSGAVFIFDIITPLGIAAGVPYVLLVCVSLWANRQSYTLVAAIMGTVLTVLGFVLCPDGGEFWKVIANRLLAMFAIWVTAILCLWQKRTTARQAVLTAERETARQYTAELEDARNQAEAATICKSEFLANMSHEIRTPMTAILGYAETIADNVTEPENIEAAGIIRRNGEHLLEIINDILDISKIEAGKMRVESSLCSPYEIATDVASLFRVRIEAKNLEFNIETVGPIPEAIQTDPSRLRQILVNLMGNSVKFTENGGIRLILRFVKDYEKPEMQFDILDTGIGMSKEKADKLFQAFSQGDTSLVRNFGGTGLGLTISKRFAEMLGGDITVVDTQEGVGTRFRVTVATGPLDGVKMLDDPAADRTVEREKAKSSDIRGTLSGCRVLFAEDGPDNQRLISFILKKAGSEVVLVENGQLAVNEAMSAVAAGKPFDVILMDMQMPVLDGYSASSLLREKGYTGPIIALTAHAMAGDRKKCLDAGCTDYATKPVERKQLIETIKACLKGEETVTTA
ncbi:MAG: ATP-binding protein [Phycisphaerales bacterium]|nr:ATP-binding protein [Phycisphaerales bacterium]